MARAWIGGEPAAVEHALAGAAELLAASRSPLIAGLATDVAGARAAIRLADRIGAVVDHIHSHTLLRELAVTREAGMMLTTPNEALLRADMLLLVGPSAAKETLGFARSSDGDAGIRRTIVRLCPGHSGVSMPGETTVGRDPAQLAILLAALRTRLAGRPIGKLAVAKAIGGLASVLKAARFGVAVWSAADLDALAIEMLCGIVADLNAQTRFTGFSLPPNDNAIGALQACGWMTGFPMRTGYSRGYPEHDPWRFDTTRMLAAGEADCLLWIAAYRATAPPAAAELPVIALMMGDAAPGRPPAIQIEVGRPGVDHDAVEHCPALGTLISVAATHPSERMSVAGAVAGIVAALAGRKVAP